MTALEVVSEISAKSSSSNSSDNNSSTCDHDEKVQTRDQTPEDLESKIRSSSEEGEVEESKDSSFEGDDTHKNIQEGSEDGSTPPLPSEPLPETTHEDELDDGWAPIWEETAQGFYFYNRFTGASQWTNPRVPEAPAPVSSHDPTVVDSHSIASTIEPPQPIRISGYNPAIHGDYDPNAWYAQPAHSDPAFEIKSQTSDPGAHYSATAAFNRFTGRFQNPEITPDNFNDENKSKRQMNAYFDVDAAANSHDGRSLKAERSGKKLSKTELKQFKEKRKMKKEEKRRAWLRD